MFVNSEINFLAYRNDLSRSTPEKDLSTFIEQMQRVSVQVCRLITSNSWNYQEKVNKFNFITCAHSFHIQIQESATSSRMSTLGNRARRLQANILLPLERLRNEIQFELTALQLQKEPWTDMVNQSLINLKTTQYFINQDSPEICNNKSLLFKLRYLYRLCSTQFDWRTTMIY